MINYVKRKKMNDVTLMLAAIFLTILIFVLGVILGNFLAEIKLNELRNTASELTNMLTGMELKEKMIEEEGICNFKEDFLSEERSKMGRRLDFLEKKFGKDNLDVLIEKETYQLIEIRTLLLAEKTKEMCNDNISIILFFYTNDEKDEKGSIDKCILQGEALDPLSRKYQDVNIFSFDINTNNPAVNTLKQQYDVTMVPTIVLNGMKYEGLKTAYEIEKVLGYK